MGVLLIFSGVWGGVTVGGGAGRVWECASSVRVRQLQRWRILVVSGFLFSFIMVVSHRVRDGLWRWEEGEKRGLGAKRNSHTESLAQKVAHREYYHESYTKIVSQRESRAEGLP